MPRGNVVLAVRKGLRGPYAARSLGDFENSAQLFICLCVGEGQQHVVARIQI